ncbi:MAG: helix-turn-helix transcriptional regulator, partial [Mogibacterium sp.]|nr:helix-turn-helix transcriptional regulator [Mogibacterium sp.]
MELGKRIAEIRKENTLTQEGLAELCNVTRQTISNWENNKSYPDLETLVLISDTFDVSLDAMLKGDRKMVSEITKEQKQGRYYRIKMVIAVIIGAAIILAAILILQST